MTKTATSPKKRKAKSVTSSSTVYNDFAIWHSKVQPSWHPIKKMRYVFFRMIGGITITDAVREIHWNPAEFWHLVDLKRHGPFREEYKRAKTLQGRSFADSVVTIAEGRDVTTRRYKKRVEKLIARAMRRMAKSKSSVATKMIASELLAELREYDKIIVTRNKLQMDASKWMAKTVNPTEYSDTAKLSLGGTPDESGETTQTPLLIQFIAPDGSVVAP